MLLWPLTILTGKENLYYEVFKKYGLANELPNFLEKNQFDPINALRDYLTVFYYTYKKRTLKLDHWHMRRLLRKVHD